MQNDIALYWYWQWYYRWISYSTTGICVQFLQPKIGRHFTWIIHIVTPFFGYTMCMSICVWQYVRLKYNVRSKVCNIWSGTDTSDIVLNYRFSNILMDGWIICTGSKFNQIKCNDGTRYERGQGNYGWLWGEIIWGAS